MRARHASASRPPCPDTSVTHSTHSRIIDATWYLPNSPFAAPEGLASAKEAHEKERLPSSVYVDLDSISDETFSPAGHNLPTEETMKSLMGELGVRSKTDPVVVYDSIGMFSSPRMLCTSLLFPRIRTYLSHSLFHSSRHSRSLRTRKLQGPKRRSPRLESGGSRNCIWGSLACRVWRT